MAELTKPDKTQSPVDKFRNDLSSMKNEIAAVLPKNITIEAFSRIVITAVQNNPDLLTADRKSLFNACLNAAKDGLLPDGKEAAFAIFGKVVSYMPMVAGLRKKAYQSGEINSLKAHVVYENDEFDFELGDYESITHKPTLKNRGGPIAVYASAHLKNGDIIREVLGFDEVERLRKLGKNPNGTYWKEHWGEMARAKVIRRLAKSLPIASDFLTSSDDDDYEPAVAKACLDNDNASEQPSKKTLATPATKRTLGVPPTDPEPDTSKVEVIEGEAATVTVEAKTIEEDDPF